LLKNPRRFAIVEAKQVGTKGVVDLVSHVDAKDADNVALRAMVAAAALSHTPFSQAPPGELPPSSTQSFLHHAHVPHVVLTDHTLAYSNHYYHSMFDDLHNVDTALVCRAATLLAHTIASLQEYHVPPSTAALQVNCTRIAQYMGCLTGSWSCAMFKPYFPNWQMPEFVANYAGVFDFSSVSVPIKFLHDVASELSNPFRANPPIDECDTHKPDSLCMNNTGRCVRGVCVDMTLVMYVHAVSPAMYVEDRIWKVNSSDTTSPVFTESNWAQLSVRVFPAESPAVQFVGVFTGVAMTVLVAILCVVATRKFNRVWRLE
jgi:hypothetical protein